MILSLLLFETEFLNIVAISFTALILNELIMVALEITKWCVTDLILRTISDTDSTSLRISGMFTKPSHSSSLCFSTSDRSSSCRNTSVRTWLRLAHSLDADHLRPTLRRPLLRHVDWVLLASWSHHRCQVRSQNSSF